MPCYGPQPEPKPPVRIAEHALLIRNVQRRQVSGAERVRAIERLAATRLGVRELGRRTGFAPSTISRWLKIDRCRLSRCQPACAVSKHPKQMGCLARHRLAPTG
jgi:IS30 family transposase